MTYVSTVIKLYSYIVTKTSKVNFKNMALRYCLIMLAASCVCSSRQGIKLFPYRQEDSETNCDYGLISGEDTVVFKAEVSGDIQNCYVYFQRKSKSDSVFLSFKDIVINGTVTDQESWKIVRPHVFLVTITDKAKTQYSGARIQGVLVSSNKDVTTSDQQIYPDIRDSTDLSIRVLNNGVETPMQNICDIHGDESDIVKYECQSKASPCWIEISADDLKTPLIGKGYVQHTSKLPEQNITIAYSSCKLHGNINTLNCHFKRDAKVLNEESNANTLNSLTAPLIISVVFNFGFLINILWGRNIRRILRVFSCIKPKTENNIDGNNAIEDMMLPTVNDGTNSPIKHAYIATDTDVDGETGKKGERLPLIKKPSIRKSDEEKHGNESIISMEDLAGPDQCGNTEKEEANRFNDLNETMTQSGNKGKDITFSMEEEEILRHMDQPGNKTDMSNTLNNQHITQPEPDNSESLSNRRVYQTNNHDEILHDLNIQRKTN